MILDMLDEQSFLTSQLHMSTVGIIITIHGNDNSDDNDDDDDIYCLYYHHNSRQ